MRAHLALFLVAGLCLVIANPASAQPRPTQAPAPAQEPAAEEDAQPAQQPQFVAPRVAGRPVQSHTAHPTPAGAHYLATRHERTISAPEPVPQYFSDGSETVVEEPGWEEVHGRYEGRPYTRTYEGPCYSGCDCERCYNPWFFSVDFLSMQPRFTSQDFAIVDPNTDGQPDGNFAYLDSGRSNGLEVDFGRELVDGWDVGFRYTYLNDNDARFVTAPAGGQLWATLAHPNTVNTVNTADASLKFKFHVLDVEFGRELDLTPTLDTRVFAGMRFGWIDHDISVIYDGGDATVDQVFSPLDFSSYGLRLGGQTIWRLARGWSIFGEASTSLLAGTIETAMLEANNNGTTTIVNIQDRQTLGVPVLDVGIGATRSWGPWQLRAGYRLSQWFNVLQRRDFSDDIHAGKPTTRSSDLLLDGFFVGLGIGR